MPHMAQQSFVDGDSVRNQTSGLCMVSRFIMSVLDGLCLPVFCFVLCDKDQFF